VHHRPPWCSMVEVFLQRQQITSDASTTVFSCTVLSWLISIIDAGHSPATHPVLVQVQQQRVIALVRSQNDTLGFRCGLKGTSQLKRDVKVQGIAAGT
jgi:hypothetical protein